MKIFPNDSKSIQRTSEAVARGDVLIPHSGCHRHMAGLAECVGRRKATALARAVHR